MHSTEIIFQRYVGGPEALRNANVIYSVKTALNCALAVFSPEDLAQILENKERHGTECKTMRYPFILI